MSISSSVPEHTTDAPTMGRHVLRVNTVLMMGVSQPCRDTVEAIWITGSCCGSGKWPLRPWHYIHIHTHTHRRSE